MKVKVKLFAAARQYCGSEEVDVEVGNGASVRDLRNALLTKYPALDGLVPASMVAIDHDYATDDRPINGEAEIALIPPVSGG